MANGVFLSTREAAASLGLGYEAEPIPLLLAAGVEHRNIGRAYLWDSRGVERLKDALATGKRKDTEGDA